MNTTYYWGDYTNYGHPTLILTEFDNSSHCFIQAFLFFESTQPVYFKELFWQMEKTNNNNLNVGSQTLKEFVLNTQIRSELNNLIIQKHGPSSQTFQFWNAVNFRETNHTLIAYLRDKFSAELDIVQQRAQDPLLRDYIRLYKSIVITSISPDQFSGNS